MKRTLTGIAFVCIATFFLSFVPESQSELQQASMKRLALKLPAQLVGPANASTEQLSDILERREVAVRAGETLDGIFRREGFSVRTLHSMLNSGKDAERLAAVHPGDILTFGVDSNGALTRLELRFAPNEKLLLERDQDGAFATRLEREELQTRIRERIGVINSSLYAAGTEAGLPDAVTMELAKIFAYDIDFGRDIRPGDTFQVIYEDFYHEGERVKSGPILAASFATRKTGDFKALRFEAEHGVGYFDHEGRNLKKAFLRAPLDVLRITSHFNPKRFHPVLKRVKPHNGIDYGAATGTPVYAAANGTVTKAGYSKYNGNYVFLKHPGDIVTKYLHLSKKTVKTGERVAQGTVIGRVGATGLATAPHLHYEFWKNGRARDPAKVELPKVAPLEGDEFDRFRAQTRTLLAQLDRFSDESDRHVASAMPQ